MSEIEIVFYINKTWEESRKLYRQNREQFFNQVTEASDYVPVGCENEFWLTRKEESCILLTVKDETGVLRFV